MAYTAPTAADLIARFPTFAAVAESAVTGALSEAASRVGSTWDEADWRMGQMLYAAHVLTTDGLGASTEVQLAGFRRIKVGSLELERSVSASAGGSILSTTSFGQRYLSLAARYGAGAVLV